MRKLIFLFLFKYIFNQEIFDKTKQIELINEKSYKGNWEYINNNRKIKSNKLNISLFKNFDNLKGTFDLNIKFKNNKLISINIYLYDGFYQDNWIMININYYINISDLYNSKDIKIDFPNNNRFDYFIIRNKNINTTLFKTFKLFQVERVYNESLTVFEILFTSKFSLYNLINGNINSEILNLNINFVGTLKGNLDKNYTKNFFFFFLSIIIIYHLYTIYLVIRKRHRENPLYFKNFSSTLIGLDIIYNCLICLIITSKDFNELINSKRYFSVIILLFFMIIFFEGVLFYFSFNPRVKSHKKIFVTFFFCLFILIFLIQFLLIYPIFIIIFLYSTFFPQIKYNISFNEKTNSIPKNFQISLLINRLFIPLYLKGFKNNIFNSKINYHFCTSLLIFHGYQLLILYFQERNSGDCIIPKKYRKNYYEYKRNIINLIKNNPDFYKFQCSICLNPFTSIEFINLYLNSNLCCLFKKYFFDKKIYIYQTPCNHYFHIECLSNWIKQKKECPICRKFLPLIQ